MRLVGHFGSGERFRITEKSGAFHKLFEDRLLLSCIIDSGVSYQLFLLISDYAPFSDKDWAEMLDISLKTLSRYRSDKAHFKPLQSERILEMAEVTSLGLQIFGDMDKLKRWLETPNFALGGHTPRELLRDSYGKELVVTELQHINHGILA
jgi:putative toxin-antitoxin system antitoxin component (TIGR02293 family)